MRHPLVRWPLGLLCLFIAYLGLTQGLETVFSDDDWSDAYLRSEAVIVGSEEEFESSTTSFDSGSYTCRPVVEWTHDGSQERETPIWLETERYGRARGPDCAEDRYGEAVPIWIDTGGAEPVMRQPGNRSAKPLSAIINLGQGALFLGFAGALLLPRRRRSQER